jgi:fumarate hydratase class II
VDNKAKVFLLLQNRARSFLGSNVALVMSDTNRLSATVREAMTIVRSLVRLYDNDNACKVALRAYEKAATERDEVELEKWRSVLSGLLELVQPKGNLRT